MLSPQRIHNIKEEVLKADLIVMQMEIPYETVKTVCDIAHENDKKVLLNVAPASKLDSDIIRKIDILVVNETEAETISGKKWRRLEKKRSWTPCWLWGPKRTPNLRETGIGN